MKLKKQTLKTTFVKNCERDKKSVTKKVKNISDLTRVCEILSELQKNPSKALDADIVRIVKNGKEVGIFMSKEEFEDLMEEHLSINLMDQVGIEDGSTQGATSSAPALDDGSEEQ